MAPAAARDAPRILPALPIASGSLVLHRTYPRGISPTTRSGTAVAPGIANMPRALRLAGHLIAVIALVWLLSIAILLIGLPIVVVVRAVLGGIGFLHQ